MDTHTMSELVAEVRMEELSQAEQCDIVGGSWSFGESQCGARCGYNLK